ncbi:MAG: DNA methylase [Lachnospiraceae bacterium]|nr:DNA methylase [Lachnospiraceae bacterium]
MARTYVAIDLKSFYASVECVERGLDPLKAKLVVADVSRTEKTICLAVSPALKAYGVPGRPRLFEVEQILSDVKKRTGEVVEYIAAPPQMAKYMQVSSDIFSIYMKYVSPDDIHVYSVDECFMDVTDYLPLYKMTAHELTMTMIRDVLSQTGITATAGIGTNLYLCKIAMDIVAKHSAPDKDGVRIAELDEVSYRRLLWDHIPMTDFWRMGGGTVRKLENCGINTMGELARFSLYNEDLLFKMFGVDAEILIDHAWGYEPCTMQDIKNYKTSTKSLTQGQVLQSPYTFDKARIVVREMVELLVLDMVDKGFQTDSVTLHVGFDHESIPKGGKYLGPVEVDHYGRLLPKSAHGTANMGGYTSSTMKITDGVMKLFDQIIDRNLLVRRINVSANSLRSDAFEQYDLFTDPVALEKERSMQKAMLSIKKKFGKNAILKGTDLEEGATMMERNAQIGGHKA